MGADIVFTSKAIYIEDMFMHFLYSEHVNTERSLHSQVLFF